MVTATPSNFQQTEAIHHSQHAVSGHRFWRRCWRKGRKRNPVAANTPERMWFYCNSLHISFAEFHFVFLPWMRPPRARSGRQQCWQFKSVIHMIVRYFLWRRSQNGKKYNEIRSSPWRLGLFLRCRCLCNPWIHCDKRNDKCRHMHGFRGFPMRKYKVILVIRRDTKTSCRRIKHIRFFREHDKQTRV